jgi:PAS domain S-box-containing protein
MKSTQDPLVAATALRSMAEAAFAAKVAASPETQTAPTPEATPALLHELEVHQIELEMQTEELRRAQLQLEASRAIYFDLYDLAPVGYCTVGENGQLQQANLTLATLLGVRRSELVSQWISRFIFPEDQDSYFQLRQQVLAPPPATEQSVEKSHTVDLRLLRRSGSPLWVNLVMAAVTSDSGETLLRVTVADITARRQADQALRAALLDKTALLQEVHHRVKNNLQVITSLLHLESGRSDEAPTKTVLKAMQGRVHSMALLHESLYRAGGFATVDLSAYLRELTTQSFRTLTAAPGTVRLQQDLAPLTVGMDLALPCGLLVNELLSNALKHGFPPGHSGEIRIELQPIAGGPQWRLGVSDTGVGLPSDFEAKRGHSLGLQLVSDLTTQIQGELQIGPIPRAVFLVTFTPGQANRPKSGA